ncbi:MAG: DNA polymerase III subunit delta' [Nitrospiraceae bacterium]|nr:DNA polymerase III subunit delta' [Nitrospiraceae bacterium]
MSLTNIIGQSKTIAMLLGMMRRGRIASSYLFCGESGIGKKTAAINFAKALNCLDRGRETDTRGSGPDRFDSCDSCASCRKIDAGGHPDFLAVAPEDRVIKIEEIRLIEDALSYKPFEGRWKVVIIDEAEAMNISAANAFLKTLEEPPPDSVIILVTSKPGALPDTIRSRCSRVNFFPLPNEACRRVLGDRYQGDDLDLAVTLSMGRPGAAHTNDLREERDWFLEHFRNMLKAGKDGWTSREDMDRWFDQALIMVRDLATLKIAGPGRMINLDIQDYLRELSKSLDLDVIIYLYGELNLLKGQLLYNLNKSITWNYTASLLRKELLH